MNQSSRKPTYRLKYSKDSSKNKPTKIIIDSSVKLPEKKETENKTQINEINQEDEEQKKARIIHENNEKVIEILQKELEKVEDEEKILDNEIEKIKEDENEIIEQIDLINKETEEEFGRLEGLKDINDEKNSEYIRLMHLRHQQLMQDSNNSSNNNQNNRQRRQGNVLNAYTLGEVMDGILRISNLRRQNNESNLPFIFLPRHEEYDDEEGPPLSYQQLQALPSYNYQGRYSNEKCIICSFDLCFNDIVTRLKNCDHIFHKNCLVNRLSTRRSSKCPNCKVSLI